jgi:arylsulfatase A-like enzyme
MLRALPLAILACAGLDTLLTRLALPHRAHDLALPLQLLLAWTVFGLLLAPLAALAARRLQAPFTACLGFLAGAVVVHHAAAARVRAGDGAALIAGATLLAAVLVIVAVLLLARLERRLARRRWPGAALLVASLLLLPPADFLRRAPAAPADSPAGEAAGPRPNLLLLIWDTTRADHLQPWGYDREVSPHLATLAERSATWEAAYSASIFTLSSHASMLIGKPPSLHGTTIRHQAVTETSVATRLRQAGYRTGAFVGTSVLAAGRGIERGFDVYDDQVDPALCDSHLWALIHDAQVVAARVLPFLRGNGNPNRPQDFQRPARNVLERALAWIREPDPRPWFAMVNLFDVHWPYLPGKDATALWVRDYAGAVNGYLFRADDYPRGHRPDAADKQHVADLYDAEIWELDAAVDRFLGELLDGPAPPFVLMTSDHGEALGEGDHWSHDELLLAQTRIPMLLFAPGRIEPGQRPGPVSGVDVAATLMDLAGALPLPDILPLSQTLLSEAPPGRILFEDDLDNLNPALDAHAVIRGRLRFTRRDGRETLNDALTDPLDEHDLSAAQPEAAADLRKALEALLSAAKVVEGGGQLENEEVLRQLGYLGH